jgi:hypothetical protein
MRVLLVALTLLLGGCWSHTEYMGDPVPQDHYGTECFEKPYINKYGDSYFCQANAIAKLNKQVDIHNRSIKHE